ncbi:cornifelin homolog B-like [Alosa pseudoharengus]|uniref:cornifelin homolog B-like n=1 Tax=Alosa pseudoharengus TaxID=34774 RepID=UPI003F88AAC7
MANNTVFMQPRVYEKTLSRDWSTGVFQCCEDIESCCCGFWCYWCFTCQTADEFGELSCLPLVDICLGGCVKPVTMSVRAVMRRRYGIQGTLCNDCVCSVFCSPCVWCQMYREMKRNVQPITFVSTRPR